MVIKEVQWVFIWSSKGASLEFQGSFKEILWKLQEFLKRKCQCKVCFKRISKKKFPECLKNVSIKFYFWNFVGAWISSQRPEQKEGLFSADSPFTIIDYPEYSSFKCQKFNIVYIAFQIWWERSINWVLIQNQQFQVLYYFKLAQGRLHEGKRV